MAMRLAHIGRQSYQKRKQIRSDAKFAAEQKKKDQFLIYKQSEYKTEIEHVTGNAKSPDSYSHQVWGVPTDLHPKQQQDREHIEEEMMSEDHSLREPSVASREFPEQVNLFEAQIQPKSLQLTPSKLDPPNPQIPIDIRPKRLNKVIQSKNLSTRLGV